MKEIFFLLRLTLRGFYYRKILFMTLVLNSTYIKIIIITSRQKRGKEALEKLIRHSVNITLLHQPDILLSNLRV